MKALLNGIGYYEYSNIYDSIITLILSIIVYSILKRIILNISLKNNKTKKIDKKKKTYFVLLINVLKYVFVIVVLVIILKINGVDVTSILAGIGVVSLIAGLALQDALKDIIMGLNIIFDGYFSVGDVLKINEVKAKVTEIGLKVTKLKDIDTGNVLVVANRNIGEATTVSNFADIEVPLRYEESIEKIEEIMSGICNDISKVSGILKCEYKGVTSFESSAILYRLRITSMPENQPRVLRDARIIIKQTLDNKGLEIPYTQIDIHNKK